MRRVRTRSGLVVALLILASLACGGVQRSKMVEPAEATGGAAPSPAPEPAASPKDEIDQLDRDITAQLAQIGAPPPMIASGTPPDMRPLAEIQGVCRPPSQQNQTCRDVCTLSDRICSAASRICELSAQLVGDADAAGKCQKGKKSCGSAQQRCCDCR